MRRVKIGDVVEIPTEKGLAYAHYTHKLKSYGALLRVFKGFYHSRPPDPSEILGQEVLFSTFYPLSAATSQGLVFIAFEAQVQKRLQEFPTFRSAGLPNPDTGEVKTWYLWAGGDSSWEMGELTDEMRKLPIRGVWNHTLLVKRIESGWRPELDRR